MNNPTDPIPFTLGMAETIAAGLDYRGAHITAKELRRLANEASAEQRGEVVRVGEDATYTNVIAQGNDGTTSPDPIADVAESLYATIASLQSQLAAEREAVRVLGAECNNKRDVCLGCSTAPNYIQVTEEETDANPIARAAVEAARKEPVR